MCIVYMPVGVHVCTWKCVSRRVCVCGVKTIVQVVHVVGVFVLFARYGIYRAHVCVCIGILQ